MPRLGILSKLYVNNAGYANPSWLETDLVSELNNGAQWNKGESSVRRGRVVTNEQTNLVLELTGTIRKEMNDPAYLVYHNAFLNATPIDIMVLDGNRITTNVHGFRYWSRVFDWSEDQALGNVIYKNFNIAPCAYPTDGILDSQGTVIATQRPKSVVILNFLPVYSDIGSEGA